MTGAARLRGIARSVRRRGLPGGRFLRRDPPSAPKETGPAASIPPREKIEEPYTNDKCLKDCHGVAGFTSGAPGGEPRDMYVPLDPFTLSIHGQQGLWCIDCHAGADPNFHPRTGYTKVDCRACHSETPPAGVFPPDALRDARKRKVAPPPKEARKGDTWGRRSTRRPGREGKPDAPFCSGLPHGPRRAPLRRSPIDGQPRPPPRHLRRLPRAPGARLRRRAAFWPACGWRATARGTSPTAIRAPSASPATRARRPTGRRRSPARRARTATAPPGRSRRLGRLPLPGGRGSAPFPPPAAVGVQSVSSGAPSAGIAFFALFRAFTSLYRSGGDA